EALIHDLKVKRFARGGSTITMQLVKNVFLTRNKNIARKLEEALIVWLIESKHLTSKARMYEVYLNIAEWGPLIYGAKEAAEYYFDKKPSQLTANEAIFLASIIPKPKHFRKSFDADMQLRNNLDGYYRLIAHRLQVKGLITEEEADSVRAQIEVGGQAKEDLNVTKEDLSPAKP
ncbi:MAG: biosynthetic peptidoglycan transglycosylase, partial [Bacteroides sp.]